MEIAQTISFTNKNAKHPSRITAKFNTNDDADVILIDGTEDFRRIRPSNKNWTSRCKYTTLQMSLVYIDFTPQGVVTQSVSYDANGNRIVQVVDDAKLEKIDITIDHLNRTVTVNFVPVLLSNVFVFHLFRKTNGVDDDAYINDGAVLQLNTPSSIMDNRGDQGIFDYSIHAIFNDDQAGIGKICATIEAFPVSF
jgi:hypothetical protein